MKSNYHISILPENMTVSGSDTVVLESHTLKALASSDAKTATSLINANGFSIDTSKLSWTADGKVTIRDSAIKTSIEAALKNPDFVAMNVCGFCDLPKKQVIR